MSDRIGIITQARVGSTRLPGKIFKEVQGKKLLEYHLERLRKSGLPIFVATTNNDRDDLVEEFCCGEGQDFYRGSEDNVLERFYECSLQYKLDTIVRVTSDCPLIDGELIKRAVEEYLSFGDTAIYYSNCVKRTFPRGFDFEIFSFESLKRAFNEATQNIEKEHVTPYIREISNVKHFVANSDFSRYRLTVDTKEDYDLVTSLIEDFDANELSVEQIIEVMNRNPFLHDMNSHIEQKKV